MKTEVLSGEVEIVIVGSVRVITVIKAPRHRRSHYVRYYFFFYLLSFLFLPILGVYA